MKDRRRFEIAAESRSTFGDVSRDEDTYEL